MLFLIAFAALAGIFTVLSPCILPILPALLAAGTTHGRLRPLGIILGLMLSFTIFTLALTAIIHITGISANALRFVAIVLIFFFGLIMIFPKLSNWFAAKTAALANLGQKVHSTEQKSGFWGGIIFGLALGLVWTPCAGPILAAITTLVATHMLNFTAVLITIFYSVGAGIPMLLIAYGGKYILESSRFLSRHSEGIRQFFGYLMVLFAIGLYFKFDMLFEQKLASYLPKGLIENNQKLENELAKLRGQVTNDRSETKELSDLGSAPDFVGITKWLNSDPLTFQQLRGKVVLVDFWTYSCINCLRTLPYIKNWYETYRDQGLVIVGVHTPEFEFEKDPANVATAVKNLGITYPVALDNDYKTWNAFQNHYWPADYLIDQDGMLRMVHHGEGNYVETENAIRALLGLGPMIKIESQKGVRPQSPEIYFGSARAENYTSEITLRSNQTINYDYTTPLKLNTVGLRGPWRVASENITAESSESYLDCRFLATQVYIVLSGSSATPMQIYLDGKFYKQIIINADKKYDLASTSYGEHDLSIKVPQGIKVYTFTFGSD